MSAMLLCRNRKVSHPYYAEDLGIHLYSGEELSYYIYHNAMLIGKDFIDERLFRFINQELGMGSLEAKLRRWVEQADLLELLLVILQDIHYYDSEELAEFRSRLETLEQMSDGKKMMERGDYLFRGRRYSAALLQYDRLLSSGSEELMDVSFRGRVWKNRGAALARQYRWTQAAESLTEAWRCDPQEDTCRMLYQIAQICGDVQVAPEIRRTLSEETCALWKQELEQARQQAKYIGKGQEAAEWMDKDNIRRAEGLQALTRSWKKEYRRNQGG